MVKTIVFAIIIILLIFLRLFSGLTYDSYIIWQADMRNLHWPTFSDLDLLFKVTGHFKVEFSEISNYIHAKSMRDTSKWVRMCACDMKRHVFMKKNLMSMLRNITILRIFSKPKISHRSKNCNSQWWAFDIESCLADISRWERSDIEISLSVVEWQPF